MQEFFLKIFLIRNKSEVSFEKFIEKFYKTVKLKMLKQPDQKIEELLKIIYDMDEESYLKFHDISAKVQYHFVCKNIDVVKKILLFNDENYDNLELLLIALEFSKKKKSIISRNFDDILGKYLCMDKNNKSSIDLEIQNKLKEVVDDGKFIIEITNVCKKLFEENFKEYKDNPYLCDFYNQIYNSFETENLSKLKSKIREITVARERKFYNEVTCFQITQASKTKELKKK